MAVVKGPRGYCSRRRRFSATLGEVDERGEKRGLKGRCTRIRRIDMGAGTPLTVERGIVIDDVMIVSTRDGSLAPGKAILVENGSIREVREAGSILCAGT